MPETLSVFLSPYDVTGAAETTIAKAKAYDVIEKAGKVPVNLWSKIKRGLPWE
jgi:hypothetical protein